MKHLFVICLALIAVVASAGAQTNQPAMPDSYLRDVVKVMQTKWPANRAINIVCHGHSVPAGYFKTPTVDSLNAYPHLLLEGLKQRFPFAVINVIVTAIGGEESVSGAKRFEADVLAHKPDVLLIDYALNDRRVGLEKARAAWSEMIAKAKARGIEVILLTPTGDQSAKLDDPADPLNQHAEQIRALAKENGVALADSLQQFKDYVHGGGKLTDLMSQVNHPNRKGHELVAAELLKWFPADAR
jgi:lysophospholipase L1-like esterase